MLLNVTIVRDNKITEVYEGSRLIHRGNDKRSASFAKNVLGVAKTPLVEKWEGHRQIINFKA